MDTNVLYYGDNLKILRDYIPDSSIDLIYLDPPFNSKATYNVLYKEPGGKPSGAQMGAFEDSWQWNLESERVLQEIAASAIATAETKEFISVLPNFVGQKTPMRAYLTMMAIRLIELRRVLKDTGSIYLHCDPTASHYLKMLLDTIFGVANFRNEIVWKRTSSHSDAKRYPKISDSILFYSKSDHYIWNKPHGEYDDNYVQTHYNNIDHNGRAFRYDNLTKPKGSIGYFYILLGCPPPTNGWRMPESRATEWIEQGRIEIPPSGKIPAYKRYFEEMKGMVIGNIWDDIPPINSQAKEALGYATQKPEALLERIIRTSSNEGDIVLDPFCGCGTAVVAAQRLNRNWIGIDVTHLAIGQIKWRLRTMIPPATFTVVGEPEDPAGAEELAKNDKYQFQWWAVHKIGGQPYGDKKKGADTGIDGYLYYMDEKDKIKKAIISVKGGKNVGVDMIKVLSHVIDTEKSNIGVFVTLAKPTKPMIEEAALKGLYNSPNGKDYPRIQILTIEDIFKGKTADTPSWLAPIPKAPPVKKAKGKTAKMI